MMQKRTRMKSGLFVLTASLLGIVGLTLGGCGATQERAYALELAPSTGPLAIDIENFRGSVELRGDPSLETIQVIGRVWSDESFKKPDQEEAFAGVHITAEIEEEGPLGTLRVRSTSLRDDIDDHHVDLLILTPRCDGLRVVNSGGLVMAVNSGGATEIVNRSGSVELRTERPMVDPVTITTTDGSIYYQVPTGSTGRFDLQTLEGLTSFIDRVGGSTESRSDARDGYTGTLNEGTNQVVARTNRGDVRVWVIEDPVALVRVFRTRLPDPRDHVFLKGPRRFTRNLPVDHPEVTGPPSRQGRAFDY